MTAAASRARDHRERRIAEVLVRYELSHLATGLGLGRLVSAADGLIGREPPESHTEPENLRLALEELGPTFIKLGQLLSTRADLLSPEYRAELSKLQDAAPAVPSEVVADIVERELRAPADAAFAAFARVPLACASVGQAHVATLHDGTEVVVKVRRPNVVEDMERDFEIIENVAARATRHSKAALATTSWRWRTNSCARSGPSSTTCRRRATPSVSRPTSPTTRGSGSRASSRISPPRA